MDISVSNKIHSITLIREGYRECTFNKLSLEDITQYTYLTKVQQADDVIVTLNSEAYYELFNQKCFHHLKYRVLKGENPTVRFK